LYKLGADTPTEQGTKKIRLYANVPTTMKISVVIPQRAR